VLGRLDTPTLLTTGQHDPMWTTGNARAAAAHLASGAPVILPGAGYVGPLLQAAPAVIELITAFWSDPAATVAHHRRATAAGSRLAAS
jgi:pimeloyl-ACP methyl ester carboxylesterase